MDKQIKLLMAKYKNEINSLDSVSNAKIIKERKRFIKDLESELIIFNFNKGCKAVATLCSKMSKSFEKMAADCAKNKTEIISDYRYLIAEGKEPIITKDNTRMITGVAERIRNIHNNSGITLNDLKKLRNESK